MFSWRLKRRLSYLLLSIGALAALGILLFLVYRPAPSCFDGEQNRDETGVDCGGSCERVCPQEIKDIKLIWGPRILPVGEGRYDAVALVQNPNQRHSARSFPYLIKVFDAANLLIITRSGQAFLNPGESSVIFESRIDVGQRRPARAVFEIDGAPVWQKVDRAGPMIKVERKELITQPAPRLTAEIKNDSLLEVDDINISVLLFDEYQNVLGVSSTLVDELLPGGRKEIVFTWPAPFASDVALISFYPHFDFAKLPSS